jgi:IS5 family transposase
MRPNLVVPQTKELFLQPLAEQINLRHPLVQLAELIDWNAIEELASASFVSRRGRPAASPRLIAGLLYLQHAFDMSDEEVVWNWVENCYWQVFTGETYLQKVPPIDPSSLTRWRQRLGEAGMEELLAQTIEAAKRAAVIKPASIERVIVDTTVMEKAIAPPTDSRLLERSRVHLVKAAQECGLTLRQNYNREGPRLALQVGRYAHAKQFKRMHAVLRTLRTRVGRVYRDIERQLAQVSAAQLPGLTELMGRVVCAARTGSRMHRQGQGKNAVRIWRQSVDRDNLEGGTGSRCAFDARQSLRRSHLARSIGADRDRLERPAGNGVCRSRLPGCRN